MNETLFLDMTDDQTRESIEHRTPPHTLVLALRFCNSCVLVLHSLYQPRSLSSLFAQLPVRMLVVLPPLLVAFLQIMVTQLQVLGG
jgi:hypothetical protein